MTPEQEIEFAAKLHYSFLPDDLNNDFLDISTISLPYRQIGGDYYSILRLDEKNTIVCLCDVTGHSVISALLAARINTYVTSHISKGLMPCELIEGLNQYLCDRISNSGTFTSFGCLLISHEDNSLVYGGAAMPPLLHYNSSNQTVSELTSETIFLGAIHPLPVKCETHSRSISSGDKLILCTDGITEAENHAKELWGIEPVIEIVEKHKHLNAEQLNSVVLHSLHEYCDHKLNDDLVLIAINVK